MLRTARAATGGDSFEDNTDDGESAFGLEVDADGYTTGISYTDSLLDSTVTTTPPSGAAVTVENDIASAGTVTTEDLNSLGGTTLSEMVESLNYAGEEVKELDYTGSGSPQETDLAYNDQGEQNQTTLPNGTIDDTIFDNLGREFEQLTGNSSGAWTTDSEQIYDNNGAGDGDPTEQIEDPGGHQEITNDYNNWEDEQVATESGLGQGDDTSEQKPSIDYQTVNNLGEVTEDETFDGALTSVGSDSGGVPAAPTDSAALRAESETTYDALGDDSQDETMDVDQDDGSILSTDTTADTYDANQDPVSSIDTAWRRESNWGPGRAPKRGPPIVKE